MKRISIFVVIFVLIGMTVSAQGMDISYYIHEYNRADASVFDMLDLLRSVRDEQRDDNGNWYYNAITVFIQKLPNFNTPRERYAIEECSRIILRGLAAEKNTSAADYIWQLVQFFNISSNLNDGYLMYEAIIALGQIDAKDYAKVLTEMLMSYNERSSLNSYSKGKIQRVVVAIFNSLETLQDIIGVKPIFNASVGWYDQDIRAQASSSLNRLMDSLGEAIGDVIISIIKDPFNGPVVKNAAWQELLHTNVADIVKAKAAVAALEASYTFVAQNYESRTVLRTMRMSAFDAIRTTSVENDIVYAFLERAYREAFDTPNTDFEEIILVVRTLTAVKTEEAANLLTEFLRGIHSRRQSGPWRRDIEREIMGLLIPAIGSTGNRSSTTIQLLFTISRSSLYTNEEQEWANEALSNLMGRSF